MTTKNKRWNLRLARLNAGFTPQEMAKKIDMSISTYYKLEQGVRGPSIKTALKISEVLDCQVEDIFK